MGFRYSRPWRVPGPSAACHVGSGGALAQLQPQWTRPSRLRRQAAARPRACSHEGARAGRTAALDWVDRPHRAARASRMTRHAASPRPSAGLARAVGTPTAGTRLAVTLALDSVARWMVCQFVLRA
eukprot:scaffold3428_cov379-Prasinococcus_capsulatus_cf.AAC.10